MENESAVGEIQVERLDDIPAIFGHLRKMRLQATIDQVIEPHGNWQGLSPGWVITIWLLHILSAHTHCMDRVQEWVAQLLTQAGQWFEIEAQLGQHLLRVYRLGKESTVRLAVPRRRCSTDGFGRAHAASARIQCGTPPNPYDDRPHVVGFL